jgi:hypothetical protein
MKKLFAYAAAAIAALIFTPHSDAKPGGFSKHMAHHHHGMHAHHFAHFRRFEHRRFAHRFEFGFPYIDYPYFDTPYAGSQIVEVPQESGDVTGSTDSHRLSMRGNGPRGCAREDVTVPSEQGGETTVHVIRC